MFVRKKLILQVSIGVIAAVYLIAFSSISRSDEEVVPSLPSPMKPPFESTSAIRIENPTPSLRAVGEDTPEELLLKVTPTLPHPSCIAETLVRQFARHDEYWKEFVRPAWNCVKHGGNYTPGIPRRGARAQWTTHTAPEELFRRLELRRLIYWNGQFFQQVKTTDEEGVYSLPFAAYFPMVSGNWPQPIVEHIVIRRVVHLQRAGVPRRRRQVPFGYFQPPTDFRSVYHTTVETVLPSFHLMWEEFGDNVTEWPSMGVITSRPRTTKYTFKPNGCTESYEQCVNSVWGALYAAVLVGRGEVQQTMLRSEQTVSTHIHYAPASSSHEGFVYGLRKQEQQIAYLPNSTTYMWDDGVDRRTAFQFDRFFVGNPTHCEPLWGPDSHFVNAISHEQSLRGTRTPKAGKLMIDAGKLSQVDRELFDRSHSSCQRMHERFREFVLQGATGSSFLQPVLPTDAVHIVFTSRKGDWARVMLDEDELVELLTKHVVAKYGPKSTVRVVKFSGSLEHQLVSQLDVGKTTIFIGNHGANLVNSLFLRKGSGVILLSLRNPGFYPFGIFPRWLHVRDIVAEQMCNRRLHKGKCKWMEAHNNDMFLNEEQKQTLLRHVDDIVKVQQS